MKHLRLAFGYALCLAVFAIAGCKPKPKYQTVGEPSSDQFASTTPGQQRIPFAVIPSAIAIGDKS